MAYTDFPEEDYTSNNSMQLMSCNDTGPDQPPPPLDSSQFDECFYTDADPGMFYSPWTEDPSFWPYAITYGLTFFVGVVGNILVIFALTVDRKARNVTSSFMVSLAVADLLFLVICVPYDIMKKLNVYWTGAQAFCKIAGFVEIMSATASVLNLTAVSVERYAVIVHPMKSRSWCTMGNTTRIILSVWVIACVFSSPLIHIMETTVVMYYSKDSYVVTMLCTEAQLEGIPAKRIGFAWYLLVIMFIVPVVVMVFCYTVVIHVLWISTKQLARMTHTDSSEDDTKQRLTSASPRHLLRTTKVTVKDKSSEISEARKQVIRMLLTIIAVFFLCWGAKLVYNVVRSHEVAHNNTRFYLTLVVNLLPYIQSCSNPIIYGFMSKNFRRSMQNGCRSVCRCGLCASGAKRQRHMDFDMDTKTANGTSGKYSPSMTSQNVGRTYLTVTSEMEGNYK